MNFSKLTERLLNINFDETEEPEKKKGKAVKPLDIQVGDKIRFRDREYVITEYINRVHGKDQKNAMQEPNTLIFKAFDCDSEEMSIIKIRIDDETVESLKNDNDLYCIEYTKPAISDGGKIIESHNLVMQAKNKKEVEKRMEDKGAKIKVTRVEKLVHAKVNKEKK